jgi:hypothetical protein
MAAGPNGRPDAWRRGDPFGGLGAAGGQDIAAAARHRIYSVSSRQ